MQVLGLQQLFEQFAIYDAEGDDPIRSFTDFGDNAMIVTVENGKEEQYTLDLDAPVTFNGDTFSVIDREGVVKTFTAHIIRRVNFHPDGTYDF